jgi:hypothetical protein
MDEFSARLRDLHLTTHNTHKRHIDKPPAGFKLVYLESELT